MIAIKVEFISIIILCCQYVALADIKSKLYILYVVQRAVNNANAVANALVTNFQASFFDHTDFETTHLVISPTKGEINFKPMVLKMW
jgi:hypothetical protein